MAAFITAAINTFMTTGGLISDNDMRLQTKIQEMKNTLDESLRTLLNQQVQYFENHRVPNKNLEIQILDYLRRSGPSNEYLIAQDLNVDTPTIYHTCCELHSKKQIIMNKKGEWQIE